MLVTHEMRFAYEVAGKVIFMNGGVICEEGDPKEMFLGPKTERLAEFLKSSSFN
jgi:polar amino acid transport system ATP-binding protein